jgi:hypothetical protein
MVYHNFAPATKYAEWKLVRVHIDYHVDRVVDEDLPTEAPVLHINERVGRIVFGVPSHSRLPPFPAPDTF